MKPKSVKIETCVNVDPKLIEFLVYAKSDITGVCKKELQKLIDDHKLDLTIKDLSTKLKSLADINYRCINELLKQIGINFTILLPQ